MAEPLPPDHPIAALTPEEKAALPTVPVSGMSHLTLSGIGITPDGKLAKSKYLNVLTSTMDDYTDIILTRDEARRIHQAATVMKHGATAAMPIICAGPLCIFAARCPWQQMGKAPVGRACIWEISLMNQWQLNYLEEYEVDPENFTEMTLVNELVEVELSLHRANLFLASNPEHALGVTDQTVGVDKQGNPIVQKQISQHIELRERLYARKHRLIKLLVGDRQEKYKKEAALKTRESRDPSSSMAALKEQMESLQRTLSRASEEPLVGQVIEKSVETISPATGSVVNKIEQKSSAREGATLHPDDLPDEE